MNKTLTLNADILTDPFFRKKPERLLWLCDILAAEDTTPSISTLSKQWGVTRWVVGYFIDTVTNKGLKFRI